VLRRIHGRARNLLRLPDGSQHWPSFPAQDWLAVAPVRQFRLRQTATERIEVDLVAARPLEPAEESAQRRMLQGRLGHPFQIVLQTVAGIPRSPGGKFEDFVCEIDA
jgi:phenylacetate-CoA ligase